jgi:hypothetical protein
MRRVLLSLLGVAFAATFALAHINPEDKHHSPPNKGKDKISFRESCNPSKVSRDQAVNNVRARLWTAGDVWWDGSGDGRYIVPKVPPGQPEVSSIFSGAVWLGGVDAGGNLKVAAQTYGRSGGRTDFWAGPLTPLDHPTPGVTDQQTCTDWDLFFVVTAREIDEHRRMWNEAASGGAPYEEAMIPRGVRGWPGKKNPFFFGVNRFELPNTEQGLAGFWDEDGDGEYNPLNGDYPIIEIRGCDKPQYPDEMYFWIYNDNGNIHTQSNATPIQMEIQVQSFAYATNDELNDMTFLRYKLINRAIEPIDSTFFAMWVDADLGCYVDDYIGCDTLRSMAYVYNEDALDGEPGCTCPQGVNTYCDKVPLLGVDYFRGPLGPKKFGPGGTLLNPTRDEQADTIVELGMSAFTYYNNAGVGTWPAGMTDPTIGLEYYRYLTGSWRDGSPFSYGGDAYQTGAPIAYAFTEGPNDPNGWSMCTAGLPFGDRRTIQASGPFRLDPGAVNELIIGVVWVPDQPHPCPDISRLQEADDLAQALFDNCFELPNGPDAPDIDIIELDRELILILTNDTITSNNAREEYAEVGLEIPPTADDSIYVFEGYKIYQLSGPNIGLNQEVVNDPSRARLIFQLDLRNNISRIFNWNSVDNPTGELYFVPQLMVDGRNEGIRHTFRVTEDAFSEGDRRLINHKRYYFVAVAYAHNEYEPFDPRTLIGQRKPYLEGRRNIGPRGDGLPYTAIPRPITDREMNAAYGDGAVITRSDGVGTGENFLDLSAETRAAIEQAFAKNEPFLGDLVYAEGRGPININIFNPLDVQDGNFELRFVDNNPNDNRLDPGARWELVNLDDPSFTVTSEKSIELFNEQIVRQFGFSVGIGQVAEPGTRADRNNGYLGYEAVYPRQGAEPWMRFVPEDTDLLLLTLDDFMYSYFSTKAGQADDALDPERGLSQFGQTPFMPYYLLDWRRRNDLDPPFIGPVWTNNSNALIREVPRLRDLNNVDIVFTSNKDLWSRCVIIESANRFYTSLGGVSTQGNRLQFDLREPLSVGKEAGPDGLPLPDGAVAVDLNGNPILVGGVPLAQRGMGWFPGYAVDVETGQRLNVFFGENSTYDGQVLPAAYSATPTGRDMMFNPSDQLLLVDEGNVFVPYSYYTGGQHTVYVTRTPYDACQAISFRLRTGAPGYPLTKWLAIRDITWAGMIMANTGTRMKSYAEGLIPEDLIVKMRVTNPYQVELLNPFPDVPNAFPNARRTGSGENNYHPLYRFRIEGKQAGELTPQLVESALDAINVVPNPYYGFSDYETSQFTTTIKITNLPAKCVVTIYSLEGKFIRQYIRDEAPQAPRGNNRGVEIDQINPALEWDLRNSKGIPIASGVYLVHVAAPGLGERTLKWFGINREFDPSGL